MSGDLAASLDALLEAAAERGARRALEAIQAQAARPALVPLRESPAGYRRTLAACEAGVLPRVRIARRSYVDRDALERWMRQGAPVSPPVEVATPSSNDIDAILAANAAGQRPKRRK